MGIGTSSSSEGHTPLMRIAYASHPDARLSWGGLPAPGRGLSSVRPDACHLIVLWMRCGVVRSVEGSDGLAPEPPAGRLAWLDNDVPACRALAVAWLERGATADRSGIRHARHGIPA